MGRRACCAIQRPVSSAKSVRNLRFSVDAFLHAQQSIPFCFSGARYVQPSGRSDDALVLRGWTGVAFTRGGPILSRCVVSAYRAWWGRLYILWGMGVMTGRGNEACHDIEFARCVPRHSSCGNIRFGGWSRGEVLGFGYHTVCSVARVLAFFSSVVLYRPTLFSSRLQYVGLKIFKLVVEQFHGSAALVRSHRKRR